MSGVHAIALPALASWTLGFALLSVLAVAVIVAMVLLSSHSGGSPYDEIGRGGLARESEYPGSEHAGSAAPAAHSPAARGASSPEGERELEMRQMLSARSERLVRNGKPALDVDAEIARLLGERQPAGHDAELVAEVRQIVAARNERRARQGLEPLDVEAEVTRTLDELGA